MHRATTPIPIPIPSTSTSTSTDWHPGPFDYQRLDACRVALEALVLGDSIARALPRGYGPLTDQLRRSLLSAYLNSAEAASRSGADRLARFRCARGEASEAAAACEAVLALKLSTEQQVGPVLTLLGRLCAMLTRLGHMATAPR